MNNGQSKKGMTPWNKGLKGVNGYSESRWKKGNVPHTARPTGYERINKDGHIEVKVDGERQMVIKHRWVWKQHNGDIPQNCVITFKNGIKTDCRIENLMMITRAELARFNQSFVKYANQQTNETCLLMAKMKDKMSKKMVA